MREKDTKKVCDNSCTTCRYEDREYDESPCVNCIRGDGDDEMWEEATEEQIKKDVERRSNGARKMTEEGKLCIKCRWNMRDPNELPCDVCYRGIGYNDMWESAEEQPQIKDSGYGYSTKYRDNILKLMEKQRAKGITKYGSVLEDNRTLSISQRIDHLEEELIDALMYCEHIREVLTDHLLANDYQRMAMRTASGMNYGEFGGKGLLLNSVMGLNGEAGEVIDSVKKHCFQGHELDKAHLAEELGDVAWYLAVGCEAIGVTLEDVMNGNVEKLNSRYPEGFDKNRSIHREEPNEPISG